jgi:hypothetical protein
MLKSAPVGCGKTLSYAARRLAGAAWILALALASFAARAQSLRLEGIDVQPLPGQQDIRVNLLRATLVTSSQRFFMFLWEVVP